MTPPLTTDEEIKKEIGEIVWEIIRDTDKGKEGDWRFAIAKSGQMKLYEIFSRIRSQAEADGARKERVRVMKIIGKDERFDAWDMSMRADAKIIRNELRATLRHAVEKGQT